MRVSSGWVHYKLDRGVDHVLIDEAQDTSPRQWDIVAHIISEFTSGQGARDGVVRTVFAVGDEKQSIFSFQGAAPREFDAAPQGAEEEIQDAGLKFDPVVVHLFVPLRARRSCERSITCSAIETIYRSIHSAETAYPLHEALADAGPSLIELWELQQPDEQAGHRGLARAVRRRCRRRARRLSSPNASRPRSGGWSKAAP